MSLKINNVPDWRKRFVLFLFVISIFYAIWNARNLILGPQIDIFEPHDGVELESKTVFVKGTVKNASFISLNGRQIFIDNNGLFSEEVLPNLGYNVIEMKAEDRFGKKINKTIRFYYQGKIPTPNETRVASTTSTTE